MWRVLVLAIVTAAMLNPITASAENPGIGVDYQEMTVNGNTSFALDLYGQLSTEECGNLFISPYSVSTALAMTWSGARNNTEQEMAAALHFPIGQVKQHQVFAELEEGLAGILARGDISLTTANSIWPATGLPLLDSYVSCLRQNYGVSLTPLEYGKDPEAARLTINRWVEEKTRQKIRSLIPPNCIDPATVMVLVNAIHFKGNWATQFDPKMTAPADFTCLDGSVKEVPTMRQKGDFLRGGDEKVELLELPYRGGEISMFLFLPRQRDGLPDFERSLTSERLATLLGSLRKQEVMVFLPRFEFTWGTTDLVAALQALGMKEAFTRKADFSGMDGTKDNFISNVLHKAFIRVDEEGSEAAAATAVVMKRSMPIPVRADRPFLFMIRDNLSGSILFLGRVADPAMANGS